MSHQSGLTAAELIIHCGKSDEPAVWREFVDRFHRHITLYISRYWQLYAFSERDRDAVTDLTQEVYLYLLSNNRRALRDFRGESEPAALSYLARIVRSIIIDHARRRGSKKRSVTLVSFEDELHDTLPADAHSSPDHILTERLAPQELHRLLSSALTGANAARDAIIFQLHVIRGMTITEIAAIPAFAMTSDNVEIIIRRTRKRLRIILSRSEAQEQ